MPFTHMQFTDKTIYNSVYQAKYCYGLKEGGKCMQCQYSNIPRGLDALLGHLPDRKKFCT